MPSGTKLIVNYVGENPGLATVFFGRADDRPKVGQFIIKTNGSCLRRSRLLGCESVEQAFHRILNRQKLKTSLERCPEVSLSVTYVIVLISDELLFDLLEPVFQDGELNLDTIVTPDALLFGHRPVRATADQVPKALGLADLLHCDQARRVAHFQGPVDVEADQFGQTFALINQILPLSFSASRSPRNLLFDMVAPCRLPK